MSGGVEVHRDWPPGLLMWIAARTSTEGDGVMQPFWPAVFLNLYTSEQTGPDVVL